MKPESIERQKKRKKEAVVGILMFGLLQLVCAVSFWSLCWIPDAPGWLLVLFGALGGLCLLLLIPALVVLKQRFKEIEGGELDAAAEY
ncbi:MAG: hypothetical protein J6A62_01570 [Oscillospiraceae bacterium]|nr:hypothetical protein [Oscillospiraceae bacterium]